MHSCIAKVCTVDHDSALHVALKSLNLKNTIHGQIHEISWNHVPTKIHKLIILQNMLSGEARVGLSLAVPVAALISGRGHDSLE